MSSSWTPSIASRRTTPVTREEWLAQGCLCVQARNRYFNRSGYSPNQRVFGTNHRLPDSLLSDDAIDPALLCENPSADFQRAEEMRAAATRAWAALDSRTRMQRSLRARHRTHHTFTDGALVFVWRQPRVGPGKWVGPGVIIMSTTGGCWVNMRGSLWRCANEQLRPATNDESLGAELINRYLGDLRWDIQRNKGPKKYVDVRAEGIPDIPGENENASDADSNAHSEEEPMHEEAVPAAPLSGDVSPQPMSEPALSREPTNSAPPPPPARDRSRSPSASSSQREVRSTAQPGTPEGGERPPFPYPFDRRPTSTNSLISSNLYVDMQAESIEGEMRKLRTNSMFRKAPRSLSLVKISSP